MFFLWITVAAVVLVLGGVRILREYERGVVFRLGRPTGLKLPGLRWTLPIVDRMVRVSVRPIVMELPEHAAATRDKQEVTVRATIHLHVCDPERALLEVENYLQATSLQARDCIREALASANARHVEPQVKLLESSTKKALNSATVSWGVEIGDVSLNLVQLKS